jgi:hypothetical protein
MKRLTLTAILAMVLCLGTAAWAWEVKWDASTGASGYELQYRVLAAPAWTTVDVSTATAWTIPTTWVPGTRYEVKCRAYVGPVATRSYSGDSSTLRWTYPVASTVVEYPDVPKQLIIQFGP